MNVFKSTLSLAGLAAVPLFAALPAQEQAPPRPTGQPPAGGGEYDWREQWPGRRVSDSDRAKLTRGMQGLWRMTQLDVPGRFTPENGEIGYMLVSGNHVSMEIHGGWFEEDSFDPSIRGDSTRRVTSGLTQTGIHTFEINEWGKLVTRSLIGTKSTIDGNYEFEPPRTERQYEIDVASGTVALRGDDGRTLIFKRMREARKRTDIYGRPVEDEIIEGLPNEPVKRDIYGRAVEDSEPRLPPIERPDEQP